MINFGNLSIRGFCSIDSFDINLTTNKPVIIRGRTGAGKSSFLSALFWVLYGAHTKEGVSSVNTWEDVRKPGYLGTMVSVYWENKGRVYQVIRCSNYKGEVRGSMGKNRLIYILDNEEVSDKRKGDIQSLIIEGLGMSKQLFLNSIMFGQGLRRLVQEKASDKKDLFEEIFNLGYIPKARDIAIKELNVVLSRYQALETEYKHKKRLLEEYEYNQKTYKNSVSNFKADNEKELKKLKSQLKGYEKRLGEIKSTRPKLSLEREEATCMRYEKELSSLKTTYRLYGPLVHELTTVGGLTKFVNSILGLIDTNPKRAKTELVRLKQSLDFLNDYNEKTSILKSKLSKRSEVIYGLKSTLSELSSVTRLIESCKGGINRVNKLRPPKELSYSDKIRECKKDMGELTLSLDKWKPLIENYNWLISQPLSNKGIKNYIFESSLTKLNQLMREYSEVLGFSVEFSIDLNSAKKDFYTLIEKDGHIVDYSELSGGQKQLVHLSMAFATHMMTTESMGINILFLDEVFENLDSECVDLVVSLIRKMAVGKSVYVITHKDSLPIGNASIIVLDYINGLTVFS